MGDVGEQLIAKLRELAEFPTKCPPDIQGEIDFPTYNYSNRFSKLIKTEDSNDG